MTLLGAVAEHWVDYRSIILGDSPLVYCQLNDVSGNFVDVSGNSRTATVAGSPTYGQPPPPGVIGGTSVTLNGTQSGDFGTATWLDALTELSVEVWVKFTSSSTMSIVTRDHTGGTSRRGWSLRTVAGKLSWYVWNSTASTLTTITSPNTYNDGNWHHVIAVHKNSVRLILYVDGVPVVSATTLTMATTNIVGEHVYIGARHDGVTEPFSGSLDEVSIYGVRINPGRATAHYDAGTGIDRYMTAVLADTPQAYLRLNETSGTTATDIGGNARVFTYTASVVTLGVTGLLPGDSDKAVQIASGSPSATYPVLSVDGTWMDATNWSVEFWMKTTSGGTVASTLPWACRDDGAGNRMWDLHMAVIADGKMSAQAWVVNTATTATSTNRLDDGVAHHVVATYDGTTLRLYVDSVLNDSAAVSGANSNVTSEIKLGHHAGAGNLADGVMDEFAYYSTALPASRIAAHYAAAF